METVLGFEEELIEEDQQKSSSRCHKLVPWLNWLEWNFVRQSLFSSSPDSVALALERVSAWRSRGCLPVIIEVTASIIEIQQNDPFFRKDLCNDDLHSEEMLAMLYCMAIMRLVNCVVEKTRKKTEVSIGEAADAIGIPRMLIDIRHEGSHRELPSHRLVRRGSIEALDWLKRYYWKPQKKSIPFSGFGIADIREEIKSKLYDLVSCLKVQSSSTTKGKRAKHSELLVGRNKFLSVKCGKLHSAKSGGSKKQISKSLKSLVQLYSSFSSEVVSMLLEFLLTALESSDFVPESNKICSDICTTLDDWKTVIRKLSIKEPELLLSLLKAVLDLIQTQETMRYETGIESLSSSEHQMVISQVSPLSNLFKWLAQSLTGLKPLKDKDSDTETKKTSSQINVPKAVLMELLRKCVAVSVPANEHLVDSVFLLSQHMVNSHLIEKLNRLVLLKLSHTDITDAEVSPTSSQNLVKEEKYIQQAVKKLELIKLQRLKHKTVNTPDDVEGNSNRWSIVKSWNPCPIGLLPNDIGISGCFPILDYKIENVNVTKSFENLEHWEITRCSGKREASTDTRLIDNSSIKKMKETIEVSELEDPSVEKMTETVNCESDTPDVLQNMEGRLMIGGVWKRVGEEELITIKYGVSTWCNPCFR